VCPQTNEEGSVRPWAPHVRARDRLGHTVRAAPGRSRPIIRNIQVYDLQIYESNPMVIKTLDHSREPMSIGIRPQEFTTSIGLGHV
jgi:hypothetical protein